MKTRRKSKIHSLSVIFIWSLQTLNLIFASLIHYRKEKDPLKPKQPLSAFFLFTNERRAALLAENKNNVKEVKIHDEFCCLLSSLEFH